MAFTTSLLDVNMPNAYVKAAIYSANTSRVIITFSLWPTKDFRNKVQTPVKAFKRTYPYVGVNTPKDNLIAMAYQILEESGNFPDAEWNV